jgi:putative thioredoxin
MNGVTQMNYEVDDFEKQVLERSKQVPVLVDFWAPWCAPCRALGPVLERMAAQANGRWELVKVNTEENQAVAAAFEIASIPAVKLFVSGAVKDEFVGALPEREIRRFLEKALPSPNAGRLEEAQQLLRKGMNTAAAQVLEDVVSSDAGNAEARVSLAQALLGTTPERALSLVEAIGPDSDFADRAAALRTLARLAQLAGKVGELPEAPVRERYLAGVAAVRTGDFGKALEAFIEVLERNKQYDNGGAKEACRAIFQLLGTRHELAERYLRAFSSALHS